MNQLESEGTRKRIGIVTLYYGNCNYGGLLQAYALERFLNREFGGTFEAEQICYDKNAVALSLYDRMLRFLCRGSIKAKILKMSSGKNSIRSAAGSEGTADWDSNVRAMLAFSEEKIRHSRKVYTDNNFGEAQDVYDLFICGSDQVWNPLAVRRPYLLADIGKYKISYAASIAVGQLKRLEVLRYGRCWKALNAISVRERQAAEQLKKVVEKDVFVAVDPVFLLEEEEWISQIGDPIVAGQYVFLYFLGDLTDTATALVEKHRSNGSKIVVIGGMNGGDLEDVVCVNSCDPLMFTNLIKHSEMVFTDSFHAMAFSTIFEKRFLVFRRTSGVNMFERISEFLELTGLQCALADESGKTKIENCTYDFASAKKALSVERNKSIAFVRNALEAYLSQISDDMKS